MAQAGSNDEKNGGRKSRWTIPLSNKDGLNSSFWENIHFGRVVVWYGACEVVNQMNINFFQAYSTMYIPSSSLYYIHPFLQNHPGVKYLVRQDMESIPSPK